MNSKKHFQTINTAFFAIVFLLAGVFSAAAQDKSNMNYTELEKMQDDNEIYLMQAYDVVKDYPHSTYEYVYHQGHIHKVLVDGIDDLVAKKRLTTLIYNYRQNKDKMKNMRNRVGIYYAPEQEAEPDLGFQQFREQINENLIYPDEASDIGVEGTVFVKFVIDRNGEMRQITADHDIDSPYVQKVEMLKEAAIKAVKKTDVDWEPAVSDGNIVDSYVVVPVTFNFEKDPSLRALIR